MQVVRTKSRFRRPRIALNTTHQQQHGDQGALQEAAMVKNQRFEHKD